AGSGVIFCRVVPVRRRRGAAAPPEPNAYPTSGVATTRSTASRPHAAAGGDGNETAANVLPELDDTKSPSANATSSSTVPPAGCTVMSQHFVGRLRLQLVPELTET